MKNFFIGFGVVFVLISVLAGYVEFCLHLMDTGFIPDWLAFSLAFGLPIALMVGLMCATAPENEKSKEKKIDP